MFLSREIVIKLSKNYTIVIPLFQKKNERIERVLKNIGTICKGTEQERNNWKKGTRTERSAEGPRSRTELNNFTKVRTCPALTIPHRSLRINIINNIIKYSLYSPYYVTRTSANSSAVSLSCVSRDHYTAIGSFGDLIRTIQTIRNNIINYTY